ncbi:hypothetical protein RRG08_065646 [Elysia crispata]|uniref:Uncharacterized protein n=1 Tax=Elysia crispata TaxID=231223 RepID=A0AAE0YNE0_9GAST|nr:hypothetical protein RRG08_065646 [Elysia crispata]
MATGGSSPCLDSNPDPSSGDAGVTGEVPGPTTKRGRYYVPVNFSDDPTIRDYTTAVNANGPRGGEKGVASTDTSRGCSRCGGCPGLSLHYWRTEHVDIVILRPALTLCVAILPPLSQASDDNRWDGCD